MDGLVFGEQVISPPGPMVVATNQSQTFMVSATTAASISSQSVTVQGTSGTLFHTAPFNFSVTAAAPFQLSFNPSSVTLGPNSTTKVELDLTAGPGLGNSTVYLEMNSTCILNTGVCTNLNPFVLSASQTKAILTLQASFQEQPVSNIPINVTGVVGSQTYVATLSMNVTDPLPTSTAPSRSTFRRTDMDATGIVYDPIHKLVFAAVVQLNEVVVFSSVDARTVATISVPEPDGVDITADGTQIIVGTRTRFFYTLSTSTLEVVKQVYVPSSATFDPPVIPIPEPQIPFSMSNGKVMFFVQDKDSTATELVLWDPATGNFTDPTPPSMRLLVAEVARSRDHSTLVATTASFGNSLSVFDAAMDVFGPVQQISTFVAALNFDGSRIAILEGIAGQSNSQIALLDRNFNTLEVYPTNAQVGNLLLFSTDGSVLYALGSQLGAALNSTSLSLLGLVSNPVQGLPFIADIDETGMIFAAESSLRGIAFIDASTPQALGVDYLYNMAMSPPEGNPASPSPTTLNAVGGLTMGTKVYFGASPGSPSATPGTNLSMTSSQSLQVTPPKSALTGPVNVTATNPDGWADIVPDGYTYGGSILAVTPSAGPVSGGTTVTIYGYGFDFSADQMQVLVGGQPALVAYAFAGPPISPFPFPMDTLQFTTPAGNPGLADITVMTPDGSVTESRAFQNLKNVQTFAGTGALSQVIYDQKRQRLYATVFSANAVDVFDLQSQHFLPEIAVGHEPEGIALTPDGSMLVVANAGDGTVSVAHPDTGLLTSTISLASQMDPQGGCFPVSVVTTSKNQAVIQISCQLVFEGNLSVLDLNTHTFGCGASTGCASMLSTFLAPSSPIYNLATSGDGSKIFVTEGYYDGALPVGLWDVNNDTFIWQPVGTSSAAAADADGTLFAKDFGIVGADMLEQFALQDVDYLETAANSHLNVFTEKLHPSGSLLYIPQTDGVDIFDVHQAHLVTRINLPVQIPATLDAMSIDETGSRIFLISATGLTIVQLAKVPLSIGSVTPNSGPVGGGTTLEAIAQPSARRS